MGIGDYEYYLSDRNLTLDRFFLSVKYNGMTTSLSVFQVICLEQHFPGDITEFCGATCSQHSPPSLPRGWKRNNCIYLQQVSNSTANHTEKASPSVFLISGGK